MYNTLDSVVRSYLADKGQYTLHGYPRYMKWAIDALREWHLKGCQEDKTVLLKMDQKNAVPYPQDMVTWSRIGAKVGDRIAAFDRDNTISLYHDQSNNYKKKNDKYNPSDQWPNIDYNISNFFGFFNDTSSQKGFGNGHNGLGYFNDNNQCKEFQFSSEVTHNEIILTYKSSGFNPSTETEVNEIADRLIRDYIYWMEAKYKIGVGNGETQARRKEYYDRWDDVKSQLMYVTYEGILDILRRTQDINR